MPQPLSLADLSRLHPIAAREARRVCRIARMPAREREDVQQEMLLDLLGRIAAFDPSRGSLEAFATVCFRHRGIRLAERFRRERAARDDRGLDDPLPGTGDERLTLAEVIPESEGLGAWCGQPTDRIGALERCLDLGRASAALDARDHPLCAALAEHTPHELGRRGPLPRSVLYRRIREVRLRLLAAGIAAAA